MQLFRGISAIIFCSGGSFEPPQPNVGPLLGVDKTLYNDLLTPFTPPLHFTLIKEKENE